MNQNEIDIIEFIIKNKELIVVHLDNELIFTHSIARMFDKSPDIQDEFINHQKLIYLRHYLLDHFPLMNMEDMSLLSGEEMLKLLK